MLGLVVSFWCIPLNAVDDAQRDRAGVEFFEKRIRPLLVEHCHQCHGVEKQESGLALTNPFAIRSGGDRGPTISQNQPERSLLVRAIGYEDDDLKMPPRGKLTEEKVADLIAWVKMGAPMPAEAVANVSAAKASDEFNMAERMTHWAYQPVVDPPLPQVLAPEWCAKPVDRFILAKLQSVGLSSTRPADKRVLMRRLTFDLTGLPPTREEVAAFLADAAPDAYERLVDRLLASPRYGERWARHWLDVVRFSETLGFEFDYDLHNAWRYRDYVIRAFNDDLPYDQFVIEHIAGDLLPVPRRSLVDQTDESIIATGFYWMLEGKQTPVDIRQDQADRIDNQIDTIGKAFLGQTISCARCHDHKFDAISTRDYYALVGYLRSSRFQQAFIDAPDFAYSTTRELARLRAAMDQPIRPTVAKVWKTQLAKADRYMLASLQVLKDADKLTNVAQVADQLQLDADQLERWTKALQHDGLVALDHPLHAWRQLTSPGVNDESRADNQVGLDHPVEPARRIRFLGTALDDWFTTGNAFSQPPAGVGEVVIGSDHRPIARLTLGGTDSGLLSDRLQGEMRSPTFTIDTRFVHLRLSGMNSRMNLVIDGYTLIMNPMYGKLTAAPISNVPAWYTMPTDRWLGHRAYLEASDSTISLFGLNPKPSPARMPQDPDGHLAVHEILFSDAAEPPIADNRINAQTANEFVDGSIESLASSYMARMLEQVDAFRAERLGPGQEDEIGLINWLLENALLDVPTSAVDFEKSLVADMLKSYRDHAAAIPAPQRTAAIADGTGEDEFVFRRGNYRSIGEKAKRRVPEVLRVSHQSKAMPETPSSHVRENHSSGSGRLALARSLADPSNPLLTRVIVNRLWQHHFGEGIVRTPDDFGRMGQPPSHPELLDYLAVEFVRQDWSIKELHRQLVLSSTYRQAAANKLQAESGPQQAIDPANRLLHSMPVRRLEAEAIRDSILAVSGRLDRTMHGPSVLPFLTLHMEGRGKPNSGPLDGEGRRSVYINARRNYLTPLLTVFDYPATFTSIGRRGTSSFPAQALTLMNDPFVVQEAGRWAETIFRDGDCSIEHRIHEIYQTAFSRQPTGEEIRKVSEFLEQQRSRYPSGTDELRVWSDLCHMLFNVKEFTFIE